MKRQKSNKKILMIIPGLKFHIDEGAKHRLYSFIDTYIGAGYQITVLLLFSYPSLKYLFKYKKLPEGRCRLDINALFWI